MVKNNFTINYKMYTIIYINIIFLIYFLTKINLIYLVLNFLYFNGILILYFTNIADINICKSIKILTRIIFWVNVFYIEQIVYKLSNRYIISSFLYILYYHISTMFKIKYLNLLLYYMMLLQGIYLSIFKLNNVKIA